jgi:hypothetical protein
MITKEVQNIINKIKRKIQKEKGFIIITSIFKVFLEKMDDINELKKKNIF